MTKFLFALAAALAVGVLAMTGVYLWESRDTPPSHPMLKAGGLPPLISVREFFANTDAAWGYAPSFDGSLLAWWGIQWGREHVFIGRVGTVDGEGVQVIAVLDGTPDTFFWSDFENKLHLVSDGRLWLADPAEPARTEWRDVTPRGFDRWEVMSLASSPEGRNIVLSNDRDPALVDLYTVRPDGGGKELLARNEGKTQQWFLDGEGLPSIRVDKDENDGHIYLVRTGTGEPWREFARTSVFETLIILGAPSAGEPVEALDDRGLERLSFVTIDPRTGQRVVKMSDGHVDLNVRRFSPEPAPADLARVFDGYPRYVGLTPKGRSFVKLLGADDLPTDVNTLASSRDGRFLTVAVSKDEASFQYFLFDLEAEKATYIADFAFRRNKDNLAKTRPVNFTARDGLQIPALLTLPRGVEPKGLPTVVLIHGGPAGQDLWQYDHEKQFLANRGYAVLSVNFRGSTGYGRSFREAGYGEYGKAMQDDIVDAAAWLVSTGIADREAMAVMGGSYGGYSAALAMTRDPEVFKAAIADYGVMDIKYQMQNNPFAWGLFVDEMTRYFGNVDNEADLKTMVERSPISHADKVEGAILLTAGKDDRVVGFEQSEEFERALRSAGKDVQAVYFEKEGHGYSRWQTEVRHARLVEDFLARTLGGRTGNFDPAEVAAKYLE